MTVVSFCGLDIETGPDALIPRAETELAAQTAIERCGDRFVDVCCGTGNLACAIAAARPAARGWALDLTEPCVELARRNVQRLGFADRVEVRQGDLFAPLDDLAPNSIDLIICNPPYISTSKLATRDDLASEPREAFDGGPYGVSIHQRVARDARALLKVGGWLVFEFGLGQERQLQLVLQRAGGYDEVMMIANAEGAPRVVAARLANPTPPKASSTSDSDAVRARLREFITKSFYVADPSSFDDATSLLNRGIIDSTGVLELVTFVEGEYGITVADDDMIPDNFDSINALVAFVGRAVNKS